MPHKSQSAASPTLAAGSHLPWRAHRRHWQQGGDLGLYQLRMGALLPEQQRLGRLCADLPICRPRGHGLPRSWEIMAQVTAKRMLMARGRRSTTRKCVCSLAWCISAASQLASRRRWMSGSPTRQQLREDSLLARQARASFAFETSLAVLWLRACPSSSPLCSRRRSTSECVHCWPPAPQHSVCVWDDAVSASGWQRLGGAGIAGVGCSLVVLMPFGLL